MSKKRFFLFTLRKLWKMLFFNFLFCIFFLTITVQMYNLGEFICPRVVHTIIKIQTLDFLSYTFMLKGGLMQPSLNQSQIESEFCYKTWHY